MTVLEEPESATPRLLVSVRDACEVKAALEGGADLIDVKEPAAGPEYALGELRNCLRDPQWWVRHNAARALVADSKRPVPPTPPARVDRQVQPATAEQPAPPRPAPTDISLAGFATLVDEATSGVPALLSGSLRSKKSRA